jgi:hypothetical protein
MKKNNAKKTVSKKSTKKTSAKKGVGSAKKPTTGSARLDEMLEGGATMQEIADEGLACIAPEPPTKKTSDMLVYSDDEGDIVVNDKLKHLL